MQNIELIMRNIASERKRLGITQEELADRVDVSKSTVARWEQGVLPPFADALIAMHELFGCSIDYLLGLTDERKPY